MTKFYLTSHDMMNQVQPISCELIRVVRGKERPNMPYWLVRASPPPRLPFGDQPSYRCDTLLLNPVQGDLGDIGRPVFFVDIVICVDTGGEEIDESECQKVGVGEIHRR